MPSFLLSDVSNQLSTTRVTPTFKKGLLMKTRSHKAAASVLLGTSLFFTACAEDTLKVGFFGTAESNSFAQGTYLGVQAAAQANNASTTFVDSNFNPDIQAQLVMDAVAKKTYDVIVIQANDNQKLIAPLEAATAAGISVVVEFSVVGPKFDTIEPQVKDAISIVDLPAKNGEALAALGIDACAQVAGATCNVAYLEGFRSLPLDTVRTQAVKQKLATSSKVNLVASVEGGYTTDSGRQAFQAVKQTNPNLNVVIGSSQAIAGAQAAAGAGSGIRFIGNGASKQAVAAVLDGSWFGIYIFDVFANGKKATELGLAKARGQKAETAINEQTLAPNNGLGTKEALTASNFESKYSD